jgi:probable phosphoglycerate mutase
MEPTRIIAIRHGETAWNVDTRIQGHIDIPLNDTGRWQATRLARALAAEPIHAIYSSDLQRAFDTARAISATGARPLRQHTGLRERCFGAFEGKTWSELETHWPEASRSWRQREPHWAPEGGESLVQLRQRIAQTLNELAAQHPGQQIVLVAHGGVMDTLYRLATGQAIEAPRAWPLGNTAINRLLWTPESLTLVGWADTRHLEEEARDETTS